MRLTHLMVSSQPRQLSDATGRHESVATRQAACPQQHNGKRLALRRTPHIESRADLDAASPDYTHQCANVLARR